MKFIRYQYRDGDKIELTNNPCSSYCGCKFNKEKHKTKLAENEEYTIKKVHHFGGGCPPVLLEIEELPDTHSFNGALPANWFIPFSNTK